MSDKEKFAKRLKRSANNLNKLIEDARKIWPDANLCIDDSTLYSIAYEKDYDDNGNPIQGSTLYLLSEEAYDDNGNARQDRIIASEPTPYLEGRTF